MQIRFSVPGETVAYLRWYAKNILTEESEHQAARHLMMKQIETMRRQHRKDEPPLTELPPVEEEKK